MKYWKSGLDDRSWSYSVGNRDGMTLRALFKSTKKLSSFASHTPTHASQRKKKQKRVSFNTLFSIDPAKSKAKKRLEEGKNISNPHLRRKYLFINLLAVVQYQRPNCTQPKNMSSSCNERWYVDNSEDHKLYV